METDKPKLEDVCREITEWEVSEEAGEPGSAESAESMEENRLEAYLKSLASN